MNLLSSYFELFGLLICSLIIFRLPIRYNLTKIAIMTFFNTLISVYTFTTIPDFAVLINLACLLILLSLFYQLPFFYSLLISIIYIFIGGILEYAITLFAVKVLNVSDVLVAVGTYGSKIVYIITGIVLLIIAWLLQRKKIGFMFIAKHFTMRQSVKGYNFALSAILSLSVFSIAIASFMFNKLNYHFYILIGLTILFIFAIYISYKQNKKQLHEKHERLKNR